MSGGYSCEKCGEQFDSRLEYCRHASEYSNNIPRKALLTELHRVAGKLGTSPSSNEMDEHGFISASCYSRRFGGWNAAKEEAGLAEVTPWERKEKLSESELISSLRDLADEIQKVPAASDMNEHGPHSVGVYQERFGSWEAARRAAGFESPNRHKIQSHELLQEIKRLHEELGRTPTENDMHVNGKYTNSVYFNRFGSWNAALEKVGLTLNQEFGTAKEVDCARCGETVVRTPSKLEATENSFCSRECFYDWTRKTDARSGENNHMWKGGGDPYYGTNWHQQREARLEQDGYECRVCGMTNSEHHREYDASLHVHHIRPLREFDDPCEANDLNNLVTLCHSCHGRWEGIPLRPQAAD